MTGTMVFFPSNAKARFERLLESSESETTTG